MSNALLLDTHIALWLDAGSKRLHATTRSLIDECWQSGGKIFLSTITAWEIALLSDLKRIELDVPVEAWIERFLGRPGVEAAPLSYRAAACAYVLRGFEQRDPADRLLIATAIKLGCPLVTYDAHIAKFAKRHGRHDGFAVAA
jgi:PIN domain nuclease of toxin-antitoxin system